MRAIYVTCTAIVQLVGGINAFVLPSHTSLNFQHSSNAVKYSSYGNRHLSLRDKATNDDNIQTSQTSNEISSSSESSCWNPTLRKVVAALSTAGAIETGYISYLKLFTSNGIDNLCDSNGVSSCATILESPYANISFNGNEIPLTLFGLIAYSVTAILAVTPMVSTKSKSDEENNRIAILCTTTAMATFSIFLISISYASFGVTCQFCILSAILSISMGGLSWFSGFLPQEREREGVKLGLGSFASSTIAVLLLFFSVDESVLAAYANDAKILNGMTSTTIASQPEKDVPPPPITTTSSERSLAIGRDLKELDSKFFGAYWCSHCYEQKQRLGKEAMKNVQYIECAKEGLNSQRPLCEEKGVPGYPTWEIGGKLYPGEMYLDELEKIIEDAKKN